MLTTKNIEFNYPGQETMTFPDIECAPGEHVLLLGQSGCGKTTLLHLLGGMRSPKAGEVSINGKLINNLTRAQLDEFRGKNIGVVFQTSHFVRSLSVGQNLALAMKLGGEPIDWQRIEAFLNRLNVGNKINSRPNELSQGEQQRVAIARSLINRPSIILADEPTSALDDQNTEEVVDLLIQEASEAEASLVVVTHDQRLKDRFSKRIEL